MTKWISIGRRSTSEGEVVIFIKGTKVLTEIPTEIIRGAVEFITKFGNEKGVSVEFCDPAASEMYKVSISQWWKREIKVILYDLRSFEPLESWDLTEIDPYHR